MGSKTTAASGMTAARAVRRKLAAAGWDVGAARLSQRPDLIAAFMRAEMDENAVAKAIGAVPIGE
jgi:hypothetical protein